MIVRNCRLIDMAGKWEESCDVEIRNGIFGRIGKDLPADGQEIFDANGRIVTPGFVDPHCMVGVRSQVFRFERNDADETTGPLQPQMRAIDAINLMDEGFAMLRSGGVTTAVTGPGTENLIGGTFAAIKTGGKGFSQRIVCEEIAYHFVLTNEPRQQYGKKGKSPATRMGSAALIREELMRAKLYRERSKSENKPMFDLGMESLMRVFDGMLVKFTAVSQTDIRTAVRIAEEFGLNYTVDVAYDALIMAEELKAHGTRCVIGSLYGGGVSADTRQRCLENGAVLEKSGLTYALMSGHPALNGELVPAYLALLHKYGMSRRAALEGMTIRAAEAIDLSARVGSIETGKDADLLVWSGDPLDYYSEIDLMLINGVKVK